MRVAMIVPFALFLMNAEAAEPGVNVCIESDVGLADLQVARMLTQRIFADIGIRIAWRCSSSEQSIVAAVGAHTPDRNHPGAFAYAELSTGSIWVFYDRIRDAVPDMRGHLLAYVLTHEIAHILQGLPRHSDRGIMKAHWDRRDYREMSSNGLTFTPYDVLLIRQPGGARFSVLRRTSVRRSTPASE